MALACLLGLAVLVSGCSVISKIHHAVSTLEANKDKIQAFTKTLKSTTTATAFEATYVSTGSTPATVVYAANPPSEVAFQVTPTNAATPSIDLIVNSSGEFECQAGGTSSSSNSGDTDCTKLDKASASQVTSIVDLYTPSHWEKLLEGGALVAGLAGDKVTSSTMTVNGFKLTCVDLVASGVTGTSTICSTSQGLLGYAKVASDATSFEITKYSSSPSTALFTLPAGATITTIPSSSSSS